MKATWELNILTEQWVPCRNRFLTAFFALFLGKIKVRYFRPGRGNNA